MLPTTNNPEFAAIALLGGLRGRGAGPWQSAGGRVVEMACSGLDSFSNLAHSVYPRSIQDRASEKDGRV